jgi:hypothetical protein
VRARAGGPLRTLLPLLPLGLTWENSMLPLGSPALLPLLPLADLLKRAFIPGHRRSRPGGWAQPCC